LDPQSPQAATPDCVESGLEPVNNAAILAGLIAQVRDPDPSVVVAAARVPARAGPAAAAAIPALVERVPSEYCWAWALETLLRIGPASIPALEEAAARADAPCEADDVLWLLKNPDARQALDLADPPREDGHRLAAGNWYLLRGRQDDIWAALLPHEPPPGKRRSKRRPPGGACEDDCRPPAFGTRIRRSPRRGRPGRKARPTYGLAARRVRRVATRSG
jgi:hypothetical protein